MTKEMEEFQRRTAAYVFQQAAFGDAGEPVSSVL